MKSRVKRRKVRQVMFKTWFPLKIDGKTYNYYCMYGKRFTLDYLHCLLLGHGPVIYPSISVGAEYGVESTYMAQCCGRRYYSRPETRPALNQKEEV